MRRPANSPGVVYIKGTMKKGNDCKKVRKYEKIFGIIANVSFLLLIILIAAYVALNVFMPEKAMEVFKVRLYTIKTGSMEPVLPVGSLVLVKKAELSELKEGDIVTFYTDVNLDGSKEVVTHYVAAIYEENGKTVLRTKREANVFFDSWKVYEEDVIGTYIVHINKVGSFADFLSSKMGVVMILADAVIVIIAYALVNAFCSEAEACEFKVEKEGKRPLV